MKVMYTKYESLPEYSPVGNKGDYSKIQAQLFKSKGLILPAWEELDIRNKGNLVVFTGEPWEILVGVQDGKEIYNLKYTMETGFYSDTGSIPPILRSIVDNDDPDFLIGFFLHDANYKYRFLSREKADELLRAMAEKNGAGIFARNAVYYTVRALAASSYSKKANEDKLAKCLKYKYKKG